ncbi:hypothetical protein I7X12_04480 [Halosimplex litoreum]|uniref:Uncharacterized protein n=1 Tax=Halosimplex litoreum TaxID=1198301 RepID=A0A7T3G0X5_9EURY|nr:hypothetical protein [Halosimplex litoreum]QPV63893.1 hypothetical protein I7X12_04480 [Halosimplex litoreum]
MEILLVNRYGRWDIENAMSLMMDYSRTVCKHLVRISSIRNRRQSMLMDDHVPV